MRFLFLYVQGFAVRAMLFRNIKKPFEKTSLISHAFSVLHTHESFARFGQKSSRQKKYGLQKNYPCRPLFVFYSIVTAKSRFLSSVRFFSAP